MIRALVLLNLVVLLAVGFDKLAASRGWRRTPEATLLLVAGLGGAPGLWSGMLLFRHKTRKGSFLAGAALATLTSLALFVLLRRGGF